jgi:CelD/BcsL family acetyltransferase involved in cellulose biosynthesis
VSTPVGLEGLAPAWRDLLGRSAADEPMLDPTWLLPWWRVYGQGTGRRLRICLFHEGGRLVGLAPLARRRYWYGSCLPFARLEPLGADVDEGDGVCSEYLNIIAERGAEVRVADALAQALATGAAGRCDELVLAAMDGTGPMPRLLGEALTRAGYRTDVRITGSAPYIPLPACWEHYLQALGRHRRYLVRSQRDFDAWAGSEAQIRRAATAADLDEGQRILLALHGERWEGTGQAGAFRAPRFAAFHAAVLPQLLDRGALDLLWLTVRDEPVAAAYNIRWNGKVYFYQCGRRPDLPREVRPGILLHAHAIRAAIAAGLREYDFLGGAARYKQQLALAARPLVQVRAVQPSVVEAVRSLALRAWAWSRRLHGGR